jgi:hypothetical protein
MSVDAGNCFVSVEKMIYTEKRIGVDEMRIEESGKVKMTDKEYDDFSFWFNVMASNNPQYEKLSMIDAAELFKYMTDQKKLYIDNLRKFRKERFNID